MASPTVISGIELLQVVVGPSIAPNPAKIELAPFPRGMLTVTGIPGKYSGAVARSVDYDMPPNTGNVVFTASFALSEAYLKFAQSLEMGWKYTLPNGLTLNNQFEFDLKRPDTMTLQLTKKAGAGWADTPFVRPKFTPDAIHTVVATSKFTDADVSVLSVEIDGELFTSTPDLVPCAGRSLGWGRNKWQINVQLNVNELGQTYGVMVYALSMTVS